MTRIVLFGVIMWITYKCAATWNATFDAGDCPTQDVMTHICPAKTLHVLQHQSLSSKVFFNLFIGILLFTRSTAQPLTWALSLNLSDHDETMWFLMIGRQTGSFSLSRPEDTKHSPLLSFSLSAVNTVTLVIRSSSTHSSLLKLHLQPWESRWHMSPRIRSGPLSCYCVVTHRSLVSPTAAGHECHTCARFEFEARTTCRS